ncbi:hypothetical protein CDCA_CDCA16G4157 [Cyanidium caldarium]|uniref:C2H2-type domain-containing protein n=1 Tax=Cyanidium caldarium TaxID=2771 RepID=A0AAV9J0N6_CYACA|nr:hypothetical protein CDCA_CDCA16G4157 [Cyanidium caldarium]
MEPQVTVVTPKETLWASCNACCWRYDPASVDTKSGESMAQAAAEVSAQRRAHYRTEWHRVNLKRKVVGVAPLSREEYEQRVAEMEGDPEVRGRTQGNAGEVVQEATYSQGQRGRRRGQQAPDAFAPDHGAAPNDTPASQPAFAEHPNGTVECRLCHKCFSGRKAFAQHERTRRHQDRLEGSGGGIVENEPMEASDESLEEQVQRRLKEARAIPPYECLFCGHVFGGCSGMDMERLAPAVQENLRHMARRHGFFVPYVEQCVDLEGLLRYLGEKVGVGYCCVWGGERLVLWSNDSEEEGEEQEAAGREAPFRSLSACRQHMVDTAHCKLPDFDEEYAWREYEPFYDFGQVDDGDDNADDGAVGQVPAGQVPLGWMLPDGRMIGHRAYRRYYRQRLHADAVPTAVRVVTASQRAALAEQYRALAIPVRGLLAAATTADTALARLHRQAAVPPRPVLQRQQRMALRQNRQQYRVQRARRGKTPVAVLNSGYRG